MPRKRTRRKVDSLPKGAMTLADYAKKVGLSIGRIYQKELEKKADFEIVTFHGLNFVIPKLTEEEFGKEIIEREHKAAGIVSENTPAQLDDKIEFVRLPPDAMYNCEIMITNEDEPQMWAQPKPRNLDELKELCPAELKGLDRSAWISEQRQIFGI
jgi:hypothetical protein